MSFYYHSTSGRLRLKSLTIKHNHPKAEEVKTLFKEVVGVKQTEVNALTGSVLIHYDPEAVEAPELLAVFKKNGFANGHKEHRLSNSHYAKATYRREMPTATQLGEKLGEALFYLAIDRALEASHLSFLTFIIR
jgi:cation transport ATPase